MGSAPAAILKNKKHAYIPDVHNMQVNYSHYSHTNTFRCVTRDTPIAGTEEADALTRKTFTVA